MRSKQRGVELTLIISGSTPGNSDGRESDRIKDIIYELGMSDFTNFPGFLNQEILPTDYATQLLMCALPLD